MPSSRTCLNRIFARYYAGLSAPALTATLACTSLVSTTSVLTFCVVDIHQKPFIVLSKSLPYLQSSSTEDFEWRIVDEISAEQAKLDASIPSKIQHIEGVCCNPSKEIWIPEYSNDVQLRLCFFARSGYSCHLGVRATMSLLRKPFFWLIMTKYIKTFIAP